MVLHCADPSFSAVFIMNCVNQWFAFRWCLWQMLLAGAIGWCFWLVFLVGVFSPSCEDYIGVFAGLYCLDYYVDFIGEILFYTIVCIALSCAFHYIHSILIHHPDFIVGLHCSADCIVVQIALHCVDFAMLIPLYCFRYAVFAMLKFCYADFDILILLCWFCYADFAVLILLYWFCCADFVVLVLLCWFCCPNFTTLIALYRFCYGNFAIRILF